MAEDSGVQVGRMGGVPGLTGKRAIVTGGSRGVGRATAELLVRSGARVMIAYRSRRDAAEAVVGELRELGGEVEAFQGDLVEEAVARDLFRHTTEAFGGVDLFVGNHGIWPPDPVPLAEMSTEQWLRTQRINVESLFYTVREAARVIDDGGRIVLVTSTAAQRGEAFHGDYAASKGAIVSLVKGLSGELAPRGVTVNSVAPGWIDTEMAAPALQGEARREAMAGIPLGRIATAADVAGPIVFLCSPLARHITGEIMNVNGGAVLPG